MRACLVCDYRGPKRTQIIDGKRVCPRCGLHAYPLTPATVSYLQDRWKKMGEHDISGHRSGHQDDCVCFII
jgi:hypothetical protein